jgi:small subunit ribosomal protein S6e
MVNKMVEFKLTIADPKTGKCVQKAVSEPAARSLIGLKVKDTVRGESIDLPGYEFIITGGSDYCGFPMRKGILGVRKKILMGKGVGFRGGAKGMKTRKTVCGEAVTDKTSQINLKITKHGSAPIASSPSEGKEEAPKKKEEKPKA